MSKYGIKNGFKPSSVVPRPYAWRRTPYYSSRLGSESHQGQVAHEYESNVATDLANPAFSSGAAGRLNSAITGDGKTPRILRGYIRRAQTDVTDRVSKTRLYFMYNPEQISRQYLSYLNSSAVDPFNTVYQSGNLVAPPSMLDFSFDLFFDRQDETHQTADHPGVYVDYQFFDMVVRNVVPNDPASGASQVPDNGVMMVNPQQITVVFSPQLTVQGIPLNASVNFVKFTHRMTPTRMIISLTLRATYFGPLLSQGTPSNLTSNEDRSLDAVSYTAAETQPTAEDWEGISLSFWEAIPGSEAFTGLLDAAEGGWLDDLVNGRLSTFNSEAGLYVASTAPNGEALAWARANVNNNTFYSQDSDKRAHLPRSADCSGLVWQAFQATGQLANLGLSSSPEWTGSFLEKWGGNSKYATTLFGVINTPSGKERFKANYKDTLQPGDVMIRKATRNKDGHMGFVTGVNSDGTIGWLDASGPRSNPQVGERTMSLDNALSYTGAFRPRAVASNSSASKITTANNNRYR